MTIDEFAKRILSPQMDRLRARLTPEQIEEAELITEEWVDFEHGEGPLYDLVVKPKDIPR